VFAYRNAKDTVKTEFQVVKFPVKTLSQVATLDTNLPALEFVISFGKASHIFVGKPKQFVVTGDRRAVYVVDDSTPARLRVKKAFDFSKPMPANYIYYDIETNQSKENRKFEVSSASVSSYACNYDMHTRTECELTAAIRGKTTCYLKKGYADNNEALFATERLIIQDNINLSEIIRSHLKPEHKNIIIGFNPACLISRTAT